MTTVAVVGLGAMGSRMAQRLLAAGHDVVVWNRDPAKAAPLTARGAVLAASPADAARKADAVVTMVADPQALHDVTEGPEGIAAASAATTVIQMSTVGPRSLSRLESALPAAQQLLDAPVLGSITEVEAGALKIFAGGPAALVDTWTPMLAALGTVIHVGPVGAGTAAKLVANSTLLGALGVLGEALALAQGLRLPREAAFAVLAATPLGEQAERRREPVERGEYPLRFALSLARKDADLILEAAAASGTDVRLVPAARTWFAETEAAGRGDDDYSAVLAHMLRARS